MQRLETGGKVMQRLGTRDKVIQRLERGGKDMQTAEVENRGGKSWRYWKLGVVMQRLQTGVENHAEVGNWG
jgi:hypothetical protein